MKKETVKKVVNITSTVLLYLFMAICLIGVLLTITAKKDADGTATVLGTQMRVVTSSSMEKNDATDVSGYKIKSIPIKSMVFVDVVPEDPTEAEKWYSDIKVGDVLTFKYVYTRQVTITHRVVHVRPNGQGGYLVVLHGDNVDKDSVIDFDSASNEYIKSIKDNKSGNYENEYQVIDTSEPYSYDYIIGKVSGKSFILGWFISSLKTPVGIVLMIILPAFLIIVFEVIKIFRLFGAEKKEKQDEETKKQLDEIEELKKKLAELEAKEKAEPTPEEAPEAKSDDNIVDNV